MAKSSVPVLQNHDVLIMLVIYSRSCAAAQLSCRFTCALSIYSFVVSPEAKPVLIRKDTMFLCQQSNKRFRKKYY